MSLSIVSMQPMPNTFISIVRHRLGRTTVRCATRPCHFDLHTQYLIIIFSAFLLCFPNPFPGYAAEKPKAADLVEDGQTINLTSERYTLLFQELQSVHNFSPEQLDQWFAGVSIDKKVLELMDRQWEACLLYTSPSPRDS